MKKSKHTLSDNSKHLHEDDDEEYLGYWEGDKWHITSDKPMPFGYHNPNLDPKDYQDMKLVDYIAHLEEWLQTLGKDARFKFNPKGVTPFDVIDIYKPAKPKPFGPHDPNAYQEMRLIDFIACLSEWYHTPPLNSDSRFKFNPKAVNLFDVLDVIKD